MEGVVLAGIGRVFFFFFFKGTKVLDGFPGGNVNWRVFFQLEEASSVYFYEILNKSDMPILVDLESIPVMRGGGYHFNNEKRTSIP